MPLTLTSNIDTVMARFSKLSVALPVAARGALAGVAVTSEAIAVERIADHTPVGPEPPDAVGMYQHLWDTTKGDVIVGGDTATIIVRQTKTIQIHGEPYPLAALLTSGHDAPSQPIVPVGKKALFWPGLGHPVMSSRGSAAAPNPYIAEGTAEAIPLILVGLGAAGRDALRAALAA
jgi:hypothetical protein